MLKKILIYIYSLVLELLRLSSSQFTFDLSHKCQWWKGTLIDVSDLSTSALGPLFCGILKEIPAQVEVDRFISTRIKANGGPCLMRQLSDNLMSRVRKGTKQCTNCIEPFCSITGHVLTHLLSARVPSS